MNRCELGRVGGSEMEFSNPVIPGFHPDPSVCRVGRDYYLVTSSFEFFPGVPIFHSGDLVHWRQLGHVLTRKSQLDLTGTRSSGGVYAPTLRHHDGTFFLITTHIDRGNFLVTAKRARGPWSDPVWLDTEGIDPSLAFLDGRIYYTRNGPGADANHPFIYQTELKLDERGTGLELTRRPRVIWQGTGGIWPEAPHLYRRGKFYYLLTAEGGTSYGHSVVVARSSRPYGPFEPSPHGPVVTHRDLPRHPLQATGHADLVDAPDGSTWAVLLAIRVVGGRHHILGRETFLAPITWGDDNWPRLGERGRLELRMRGPAEAAANPETARFRDDFSSPTLGPGWVFVRNPERRSWSLRERNGHLRLWGAPPTLCDVGSPALVCRRQQHFDVVARTLLEFDPEGPGEQAGLCIRANELFHITLSVEAGSRGRELRLTHTAAGRSRTVGLASVGKGAVTLELRATAREYVFRGGTGSRLRRLGVVPTKSLSAETIAARTGRNHFTGNMIGLYATGNGEPATVPADFAWFEYAAR